MLQCKSDIISSYLPGSILAISAQRFPSVIWHSKIVRSSFSFQASFEMFGLRWLCHRSRHCFPILPGRLDAINDHFFAPYFSTNSTTLRSSSAVHGPLINDGFKTFCQRCKHCTSLRPGRRDEMSFQFFAPCSSTASLTVSSSCLDHLIACFFPLLL